MAHLQKVYIPSHILVDTSETLRIFGEEECEGLLLWLGRIMPDNVGHVERMIVPPQNSIQSEDGVGYFVTSTTLFSLNKFLAETGLRLLAQVHSHPGRAYHSAADDRYCIVTTEGGFSIVVPNFGHGPADLYDWAVYQLIEGLWEKMSVRQVKTVFVINDKRHANTVGKKKISIRGKD